MRLTARGTNPAAHEARVPFRINPR